MIYLKEKCQVRNFKLDVGEGAALLRKVWQEVLIMANGCNLRAISCVMIWKMEGGDGTIIA